MAVRENVLTGEIETRLDFHLRTRGNGRYWVVTLIHATDGRAIDGC